MRFQCWYAENEDYKTRDSKGNPIKWLTSYRRVREELQAPPSQLWFCRVCGKVYARVEVEDLGTGNVVPYISIASTCERHNRNTHYSIYTGGSILAENLNNIMEMPEELVEKEFWIHLRETERLIKLGELGNE